MMLKLTDYLAQALVEHGIRHVFLITGGGAMHLNDSIGRNPGLKFICNHHEQASAMAAEGYARATGRMAAVNVTSGPGGTNAITGVIGQWLDSIPCLYLSGTVKQATLISSCPELKLRQLGDQEINIIDIVRPVTKYAQLVRDPLKIRYHLEKAIYLARHGRPGPVWLDIPLDVQAAKIDPDKLLPYDPAEDELHLDTPLLDQQIRELFDRLKTAQRPVILVGHGVRLSGAAESFLQLVESLNIPILTAICGHDLIPSDHPLFFGRPGICGDRVGNFVVQNCDFFLAIGARMGVRQISYSYDAFARAAYRAMVDIDPNELQKPTLRLHMPVQDDARHFIAEFQKLADAQPLAPKTPWLDWCRNVRRQLPTILDDNPPSGPLVNSYVFADRLFRRLKSGDLVITANGTAYTGTFQVMHINKGVRVFTNQACASMGYDLPASIGACIGRDHRPVVMISGDGSIQMNIQELQTVVAHRLPIKMFFLNNQGYLAIRITQNTYFDGNLVGSSPESGVTTPDILKIAAAYGIKALRVSSAEELDAGLDWAFQTDGPTICELMMSPTQSLLPKLSSDVRPDGSMVSKPLEDMYPFIPRPLFRDLMIIPPLD